MDTTMKLTKAKNYSISIKRMLLQNQFVFHNGGAIKEMMIN